MIVIADAGPLRYLILIEKVHILQALFGIVIVPSGVLSELTQTATPKTVRSWMHQRPNWLIVKSPRSPLSSFSRVLGAGEQEAIALATELDADVLLVDDEAARREAQQRGIPVQGTLGVLDLAAEHDLVDLPDAIERLRSTNFRASRALLEFFLKRDAARRKA